VRNRSACKRPLREDFCRGVSIVGTPRVVVGSAADQVLVARDLKRGLSPAALAQRSQQTKQEIAVIFHVATLLCAMPPRDRFW
jgi:hypothetical protein